MEFIFSFLLEICTLTCLNGGQCHNLADGTVQCLCPNLYSGLNCEICKLVFFFNL